MRLILMDYVERLKTCQSNEEEEPCSKRLKWEKNESSEQYNW